MADRLQKIICDYSRATRTDEKHLTHCQTGKKAIDAVIDRYRLVWQTPSAFAPNWEPPKKAVAPLSDSPYPGPLTLIRYRGFASPAGPGPWDHVRRAAAFPQLSRLNYIKQLSTTNIAVNIDATHNRLSHLLGTLDICASMLQEACRSAPIDALPLLPQATATLIFALIHDLYHGPFGHSLDRLCDLFFPAEDARIDKAALAEELTYASSGNGELWSIIEKISGWIVSDDQTGWNIRLAPSKRRWTGTKLAHEIVSFLGVLLVRQKIALDYPNLFWLRELVDSELDADRLDYLSRDTEFLHWSDRPAPPNELIRGLQVLQREFTVETIEPELLSHPTVSGFRIHWDKRKKRLIGDLLKIRAELYMVMYESPEKRAFDEMLSHSLASLIRNESSANGIEDQKLTANYLRRILGITDDELFHLMYELSGKPGQMFVSEIVHDLAIGRPFQCFWKLGIPWENLVAAQNRSVEILAEWAGELEKYQRRQKPGQPILPNTPVKGTTELFQHFSRHVNKAAWNDLYGIVYALEGYHGRNFRSREKLERSYWKQLVSGGGDRSLQRKIAGSLNQIGAQSTWSCMSQEEKDLYAKELATIPQVFLSIPWTQPGPAAGNLANWDSQTEILFHLDGKAVQKDEMNELTIHQKQEFYPVAVYAPAGFTEDKDVVEFMGRLFCRMFLSGIWYLPDSEDVQWWASPTDEESRAAEESLLDVCLRGRAF